MNSVQEFSLDGHASLTAAARRLLAQRLLGQRNESGHAGLAGQIASTAPAIARLDPRPSEVALSPAQQRLYFLDQLDPNSSEYLMPSAWRLTGRLNVGALESALADLVRRHDQLRTRFPSREGTPYQQTLPTSVFVMARVDLTGTAAAIRADAVRQATLDAATRPFDLAAERPFRATLIRIAEDEHVLVLAMHHIVSDAWSLGILVRDLEACYRDRVEAREPVLSELPISYSDYAAWSRDENAAQRVEADLAHWREQLADLAPLELPTDRPRPAERSSAGAVHELVLSSAVANGLQELGDRFGTTMFMTLLAAVQVTLGFHTGQDDIAVGTIVAGRDRPETQGLVGFFVNTLVIRADLSGAPTLAAHLEQVRRTVLDAFDHQEVPFERLVDELSPERGLDSNPLFQVLFAYEADGGTGRTAGNGRTGNTGNTDVLELGEATGTAVPIDSVAAKFDLSIHAENGPDALKVSFVYREDLFNAESVASFATHFEQVLQSLVAAPDTQISELDLLSPVERTALLASAAPATAIEAGPDRLLPEEFARQVALHPDAVAVFCAGRSLTYAELDARAEALATVLRRGGVGPQAQIGICLARSEWLAVAVLGVWKAGAAYVPLDPEYPAARLAYMVKDAELPVIVTDRATRTTAEGLGVDTVVIDTVVVEADRRGGQVGTAGPHPDHAAYVIYTSGSTGEPKGVVVTHHNVARLFRAAREHFDFGPSDVWSLAHSYSFDFSVWELWGALSTGARVVIVPTELARDPEAMAALLRAQQVSVLSQTPAAFRGLREHLGDDSLRTVVFGGDALLVADFDDWFAGPAARPRLVNMYGITETTVHVTYREITAADVGGVLRSPIGVALPDLRCHVLDQYGRLVPFGVPGELYVSGPGLARGYLGRAGLTASRFVPDPFGPPGGRLYRTGDRVRQLADGELEFLGRVDSQVKVRGFRIELGEIESALRGYPGIADAAVVTVTDDEGNARLVGHVATAEPIDNRRLRAHLSDFLPDHMVPAPVVAHHALPLTAHGKLDRAALRRWTIRDAGAAKVEAAPRAGTESVLASIWADVLGLDRVGADDNFFHLGGDSILALRVIGRARGAGLALTVPDVFRFQILAELARCAEQAAAARDPELVAPFALVDPPDRSALPEDVADAYPLTALQTGMLHEMLADPDRAAYHNVTSFRLHEPAGFDLTAFQAAADTLLERHENLRTSVDLAGYSEPLQLLHRRCALPVGYTDLRDRNPAEQQAIAMAWVREEFSRPLELAVAPLVRLYVHRLTDQEYRLTITDCHIALDGWSLTSLIADLQELHRAALLGQELPTWPVPAARFADYVALEREARASEDSRAFWRSVLDELEPVHLAPAPGPAVAGGVPYEALRSFPHLREPLAQLARIAGVPAKTVYLAAYYRLMSLFAGDEPYSAGVVTNGRLEHAGSDRMSGLFLNTVPFGFRSGARSWLDYLRETFAAEQAMLPHRRYPLADMQLDCGRPPVETLFNFINFHRLAPETWQDSVEIARTNYHLYFNVNPTGLSVDVDPGYLHPAAGEQLAEVYAALLESMVADPYGSLARPALTGSAREVMLTEWAAAPVRDSGDLLLHELVHDQAVLHPDAVALSGGDRQLSYAEFDRATDQLARELAALGVGPESRVGICLDRGPDLIIAILGVLKSGGAYVPLDPEYPAERVAFMVRDSGMSVLLTQSGLAADLPDVEHTVLLDRPDRPTATAEPADGAPVSGVGPDNLAYILYTSGSTGTPKGVGVPHRGLTNIIHAQRDLLDPSEGERVLQFASPSFDVSLFEISWALANGARLCTASKRDLTPGADLARTVRQQGVTAAVLPPSALSVMNPDDLPSVATMVVAGEACAAEIADAWAPNRRLVNGYGPTECSIVSTMARCAGGEGRPLIGRPVRNTEAYVLDADLQPVPVGVPGELYLGGAGVARCYLDRPATTANRFVPDPFSARPGARLYRTGDSVRYSCDGSIDYIGRFDNQVKLRGFRIELGEVESAIRAVPGVRAVAVLVREDRPGDQRLVAYVELADGSVPAEGEIGQALRHRLPAHMVPSTFVVLDALPLTGSHKINRRALPVPSADRPVSAGRYVAPRTPAERAMAELWAEVLGVDEIGIHDDFFALGGNSLSTVRVVSLARARGLAVSVRELVETPTIARLAAAADSTRDRGGSEVLLRPGEGAPLYCVHPTGGSVTWYLPLARQLTGNRPVVGFQAQGLAGGTDPTTVPEIAASYVAAILASKQPGPHSVIGWSMGANLALEMAVQLHEAGQPVDPLILIEPYLSTDASRRELEVTAAAQLEALELRDRLRALLPDAPDRSALHAQLRSVLLGAGMLADEVDLELDAPIEVWHSLLRALAGDRPRRYAGPVHLVVGQDAADQSPHQVDCTSPAYLRRWRDLAGGGLAVHRLPGDHRSMLTEPLVHNLVALVEAAQAGVRT
jgi:amino acid adenylation domain-containing protein